MTRVVPYPQRRLLGRLPVKRVYGPGRPDPRVAQYE